MQFSLRFKLKYDIFKDKKINIALFTTRPENMFKQYPMCTNSSFAYHDWKKKLFCQLF